MWREGLTEAPVRNRSIDVQTKRLLRWSSPESSSLIVPPSGECVRDIRLGIVLCIPCIVELVEGPIRCIESILQMTDCVFANFTAIEINF